MAGLNSKIALDKIRKAEQENLEILEEAKREAAELLLQARLAKEGLLKTAQEKARLEGEKLKAASEEDALRQAAEIKEQALLEARGLREAAAPHLDEAVRLVRSKF